MELSEWARFVHADAYDIRHRSCSQVLRLFITLKGDNPTVWQHRKRYRQAIMGTKSHCLSHGKDPLTPENAALATTNDTTLPFSPEVQSTCDFLLGLDTRPAPAALRSCLYNLILDNQWVGLERLRDVYGDDIRRVFCRLRSRYAWDAETTTAARSHFTHWLMHPLVDVPPQPGMSRRMVYICHPRCHRFQTHMVRLPRRLLAMDPRIWDYPASFGSFLLCQDAEDITHILDLVDAVVAARASPRKLLERTRRTAARELRWCLGQRDRFDPTGCALPFRILLPRTVDYSGLLSFLGRCVAAHNRHVRPRGTLEEAPFIPHCFRLILSLFRTALRRDVFAPGIPSRMSPSFRSSV